jgi:hypothetical protein
MDVEVRVGIASADDVSRDVIGSAQERESFIAARSLSFCPVFTASMRTFITEKALQFTLVSVMITSPT